MELVDMQLFGMTAAKSKMLVLIIIALIAMASVSYALVVLFMGGSQIPKVTWRNNYGTEIHSLTLSFDAPGSKSAVVTFTCSPSAGPVQLSLVPELIPTVTLSQTNFPSCNSTPNTLTITATSSGPLSIDGTIHAKEPYTSYRTLANPLAIIVEAT